jgi:hypothetical protein
LVKDYMSNPDQEDGFMAEQKRISSAQEQKLTPGKWLKLRLDEPTADAQFGIVTGPCHFILDFAITTDPYPAGRSVMIRAVNTEGDADNAVASHPIAQYGATDTGPQHFAYSAQGYLSKGQWLRVQGFADSELTITKSETRVTTW